MIGGVKIRSLVIFLPLLLLAGAALSQPSVKQKQTPGMSPHGDVVALKSTNGMVVVWNRSEPFFLMNVPGRKFAGYGGEGAYFTVDDVFLQVISVPTREFQRAGAKTTTRQTLEAHRDWDYRNMQRYMGAKSALRSEFTTLTNGTPVLYWQVTPEHTLAENGATTYLMVTRLQAGSVIGATSVETAQVSLARAKALVFAAISDVRFSSSPYDVARIQRQLATQDGRPN